MSRGWLIPNETKSEFHRNEDKEELFVFGYGCKLFRDDEKALHLDRGSHLIPWMGDEKILIDRYDGRGHLFDLSPYDAVNAKDIMLSDEEKQMEKLCDEERYLELTTDIQEKIVYEEEEWKRYYESLSEGYNAVGFSYDHHQQQQQAAEYAAYQKALRLEEAKPYIVPKELQLPPNIVPPDNDIINARVEKTAKFVANHGAQMEILIKTKQAGNSQFDFLHFEDKLNPYYKHMVKMIKSGKYKPRDEKQEKEEQVESPEKDDADHSHGYLHPSLMAAKRALPAPELPSPQTSTVEIPKVSIHDTPYGQLIKSLQKSKEKTETTSRPMKDVTSQEANQKQHPVHPPPIRPPPVPTFMTSAGYGSVNSDLPPPPGLEPVTLPTHDQPLPPGTEYEDPQEQVMEEQQCEISRVSPITTVNQIVPPPPDVQPVVDRMAMYVAKNGIEFEIVVKSKNDPRFEFLLPHHVHYPYYNFKKEIHMREAAKERDRKESEKPTKLSFSIKTKPKEAEPPPRERKRKVFDNESSEDDGDSERDKSSVSGTSTPLGSDSYQMMEEKPPIPQEEREKKLAENRLKDKLAQAAREKMAQASREKQMQAERKRKAAMFLNMLRSCNPAGEDTAKEAEETINKRLSDTTPSSSPARVPELDRVSDSRYGDTEVKDNKEPRTKRSRSRSPKKKRKKGSRSPSRRKKSSSKSPSRQRSRSPRHRVSRSPSYSSVKSRSESHSRRSDRDSSSKSSKKSKKKRRSRSRSPRRKSKSRKEKIEDFVDLTDMDGDSVTPDTALPEPSTVYKESEQSVQDNRLPQLPGEESKPGIYDSRLSPAAFEQDDSNSNSITSDSRSTDSPRNASNYMLSRVRAIIKASREAVLKEEGPLLDDT